jgi:hypothetical protein
MACIETQKPVAWKMIIAAERKDFWRISLFTYRFPALTVLLFPVLHADNSLHTIEANIYGCDLLFENYLVMLCFKLDILFSTGQEKVLKRQLHRVKVLFDFCG